MGSDKGERADWGNLRLGKVREGSSRAQAV